MAKKLIVILMLLAVPSLSSAYSKTLGVGLQLFEPTGVAGKTWLDSRDAVAFAAGWSSWKSDYVHLHADYVRHFFNVVHIHPGEMPLYVGVGIRTIFQNDNTFALRLPLGLSYLFEKAPIELFAEIVPTLNLVSSTSFEFRFALGFRFYFK